MRNDDTQMPQTHPNAPAGEDGRVAVPPAASTDPTSGTQPHTQPSRGGVYEKGATAPASKASASDAKGKAGSSTRSSAPTPVPVLVAMASSPATGGGGGYNQPVSGGETGHPITGRGLSWLMSMMPDVVTGNSQADAKGSPADAPQATQSGAAVHGGSGPQTVGTLSKTASGAANPPDGATALKNSDASAASPKDPNSISSGDSNRLVEGKGKTAAPTAQEAAGMQSAAQTLENAGLGLLSMTTSADGGALPSGFGAKTTISPGSAHMHTVAAASPASAHSQAGTGQDPAKDLASGNPAQTQAAPSHADTQSVKPAAATTGDGAKNGASQDSQTRQSNSLISATAANTAAGGSAAAASNASQGLANGFPAALAQASNGSAACAGAPAQAGAPQAGAGDKIAAAMDIPLNAPKAVVNAASLLATQGRSEMRVALQTENLGTLQLHAVLEGGRLGASIAVVGHEAHTLLSNELPALQQVLTDQHLRIDHLTVINSPMSAGAGTGDSGKFQSGNFGHPQGRDMRWYSPAPPVARGDSAAGTTAEIKRRLSVRA